MSNFMWEFPSIQSFLGNNAFIIFWTLGVLAFSAFACTLIVLSIKRNTKESAGAFTKNAVIGAVAFLLAFFTSWNLISRNNEISQCRNIDLNQVKSVRVKKMSNEESSTGLTVLFKDVAKIQEGLQILKNAESYKRRKLNSGTETYLYGYQIQISDEKSSTTVLLHYFSENNNSQKIDVVIPKCSADSGEIKTTDDIYSSTDFGNWIRENIEPAFKKN